MKRGKARLLESRGQLVELPQWECENPGGLVEARE
jgi:hypothetical protein